MNVCDYCGAVFNETCGGCAEPHAIVCRRPSGSSVKAFKKATRYEAEASLKSYGFLLKNYQLVIMPFSLWKEKLDDLVSEDWRP